MKVLNTERIGQKHDIVPNGHKVFIWDVLDGVFVGREQMQNDKSYHCTHALNLKNAEKKITQWRINLPIDVFVGIHLKYSLNRINKYIDDFPTIQRPLPG